MKPKSNNSSFLFLIIAFILGLVIGLVVLGWGLWPVQWVGGTMDILSPEAQRDFLISAIESYAYNPDIGIAQQRYASLGEKKEKVLSEIIANPGDLKKDDIDAFVIAIEKPPVPIATAEAVAPVAQVTSQAKTITPSLLSVALNRPIWMNVCLPVGMLIVVVLVILMVFFSRRSKKTGKSDGQSIKPLEPEEAGMFAEISGQGQAGEVPVEAAQPYADTGAETAIPVENELPDWLREASPVSQPVPAETKIEEPAVELSESDIKDITSSEFSSLESNPAPSPNSGISEQAFASSNSFVPDGSDQPEPQLEPVAQAAAFQETQQETFAKFSREIELTPGIDPEDARKLRSLGITAPLLLLKKGATPQGRQSIASALGIPEMQVLKWVNSIDLLRIKGLTIEDAQMLNAAGVDILVEMATRDPESLLEKLVTASKTTNPFYNIPTLAQVENWITQARDLPRIISYS